MSEDKTKERDIPMNHIKQISTMAGELEEAISELPKALSRLSHCDKCGKTTLSAKEYRQESDISFRWSKDYNRLQEIMPDCVFCMMTALCEVAYFARGALERGDMRRAYNLLSTLCELQSNREIISEDLDVLEDLDALGQKLADSWLPTSIEYEATAERKVEIIEAFDQMSKHAEEKHAELIEKFRD